MSSNCIAFRTENIVDVVSAVKQHFHSGCVYLLLNQQTELQDHEMHIWIKRFVQNGQFPVSSMPLDSARKLSCRHNRPLYVICSSEQSGRETLRKLSEQLSLSVGIWLLFLDRLSSVEELLTGVDIPFNSEFLVAHPEGKDVISLIELYRWRSGDKARVKSVGFFGAMWEILEREINFKSDYSKAVDNFSGARQKNGSWSGILGMMVRGEVQISNIPFVMTSERQSVVDFTLPLTDTRTYIIIRKPNTYDMKMKTLLQSFSIRLWIAVVVTMIFLTMLLTTIQHLRLQYECVVKEDLRVLNSVFLIFTIFLQQGCSVSYKSMPLRLLIMTSRLTALALLLSYNAAFISDLAVPKDWLPFRTFQQFLKDGSYRLGMMRNTAQSSYFNNSKDPLMSQIYDKLVAPYEDSLPVDDIEGIWRLCTIRNYALAAHTFNLINVGRIPNCTIATVPEAFFPGSIAVAVSENSPYKEVFNQKIQRLRSSGVLQRTYKRFWVDVFRNVEDPIVSIDVRGIIPVLYILAVGVMVGVGLTVLECRLRPVIKAK